MIEYLFAILGILVAIVAVGELKSTYGKAREAPPLELEIVENIAAINGEVDGHKFHKGDITGVAIYVPDLAGKRKISYDMLTEKIVDVKWWNPKYPADFIERGLEREIKIENLKKYSDALNMIKAYLQETDTERNKKVLEILEK